MRWELSHRFDAEALPMADRHYNRRKIGSPQFVPPGRCLVLLAEDRAALWVTSWPFAEYVRHAWPGAWVNSLFRREGGAQASGMMSAADGVPGVGHGDLSHLLTGVIRMTAPEKIAELEALWVKALESLERHGSVEAIARANWIALGFTPGEWPESFWDGRPVSRLGVQHQPSLWT